MIFDDIRDVKKYLGGSINANVSLDSVKPFFDLATSTYIVVKIGALQLADLNISNADAAALSSTLGANYSKFTAAREYLKAAIAWFGTAEYLPSAAIMLSESGLIRQESDTTKSPYKYQAVDKQESHLKQGFQNLETLLEYLEANTSFFTHYRDSEERDNSMRHLLCFSKDFMRCGSLPINRKQFEEHLSFIDDVEEFCVRDFLGSDLWQRLLTKQHDASASINEKTLIRLLRKGIADFAIANKLQSQAVQTKGNATISRESRRDDDVYTDIAPRIDLLSAAVENRRNWSDRYFGKAEQFIKANQSDFSEWQGFVFAAAHPAPATTAVTTYTTPTNLKFL